MNFLGPILCWLNLHVSISFIPEEMVKRWIGTSIFILILKR